MPVMEETTSPPVAAGTQLSRSQIMDATARCLREEGYDATTIRRIASRLDCAVGSIYRYFQDKRDLLDAVAQATLEPAAALVDAGGSVEDSALLYHELAVRDPALHRLMFWITAVGPTGAPAGNGAGAADAVPAVVRRIVDGWSRRLGDEALARQCWMTLHGCVAMGLDGQATLAQLREMTQPSHAPLPRRVRQPRSIAPLAPVVVLSTMSKTPVPLDQAVEPAEDVVLL